NAIRIANRYMLTPSTSRHPSQQLRVELPYGIIQYGSEANPSQVGNQQHPGQGLDAPEADQRRENRRPQQDDLCERQSAQVPPKERLAPQCMECELRPKKMKAVAGCPVALSTPDPRRRSTH